MLTAALEKETEKLLACVHCGLCLQACPTYKQLGNENDSPRGRIYLMRAVAEGKLDVSPTYHKHIDQCLGCRACETACPSGVRFGNLLEAARAEIAEVKPEKLNLQARIKQTIVGFGLKHIFTRPSLLGLGWRLMKLLQQSGLVTLALQTRLFSFSPRLEFIVALLEQAKSQLPEARDLVKSEQAAIPCSQSAERGSVSQFTGCIMEGLFNETNRATARVLSACGFKVESPQSQVCCGALHAHSGFRQSAIELAKANVDLFVPRNSEKNDTPIAVNAAGCGAMLKEYGELLAEDPDYAGRARILSSRVKDVSELPGKSGVPACKRLPVRVTYDAPCHLYHGQGVRQQPLDLLRSIPGIDFVPLPGAENCCGSAGIYNITHPEMAGRLLEEKVENIKKTKAKILVTGNPGCAMHIGAGLRLAGEKILVLHPMELLDLVIGDR
jgi:glycolate oxidase iron-sulfur subunit